MTRLVEKQAAKVVKSIRHMILQACTQIDVLFICEMWSSLGNDCYLTIILHWFDKKRDIQTIVLAMMAFNVQHTKCNISKAMLRVRSKFGILPHVEFIVEIPQFIPSDWRESQNLGFEFMSVWIVVAWRAH